MLTLHRNGKFAREPFDPEREFAAARPFTCRGTQFKIGAVFTKSLVNTRRLRQMYEHRLLTMLPYDSTAKTEPEKQEAPVKPEFVRLSSDGLRAWLTKQNVVPKPKATRTILLQLAEETWKEMTGDLTTS